MFRQVGVRGQAVGAGVVLGDGERDLFPGGRVQHTLAQRAGQVEVALEQGGAVGHRLGHVRGDAHAVLHGGE